MYEYGVREIFVSPVQLTTRRIGNLTRLIHTLATCIALDYVCDHTSHRKRWGQVPNLCCESMERAAELFDRKINVASRAFENYSNVYNGIQAVRGTSSLILDFVSNALL